MSEMVERVARAILLAGNEATSGLDDEGITDDMALAAARAAIEAMREPTEAMWDAGSNCECNDIGLAAAKDAWQAMIDEALK